MKQYLDICWHNYIIEYIGKCRAAESLVDLDVQIFFLTYFDYFPSYNNGHGPHFGHIHGVGSANRLLVLPGLHGYQFVLALSVELIDFDSRIPCPHNGGPAPHALFWFLACDYYVWSWILWYFFQYTDHCISDRYQDISQRNCCSPISVLLDKFSVCLCLWTASPP